MDRQLDYYTSLILGKLWSKENSTMSSEEQTAMVKECLMNLYMDVEKTTKNKTINQIVTQIEGLKNS